VTELPILLPPSRRVCGSAAAAEHNNRGGAEASESRCRRPSAPSLPLPLLLLPCSPSSSLPLPRRRGIGPWRQRKAKARAGPWRRRPDPRGPRSSFLAGGSSGGHDELLQQPGSASPRPQLTATDCRRPCVPPSSSGRRHISLSLCVCVPRDEWAAAGLLPERAAQLQQIFCISSPMQKRPVQQKQRQCRKGCGLNSIDGATEATSGHQSFAKRIAEV